MPPSVLDTIYQWSDVQSILQRANESEITFKWPLARRMLTATVSMYRWYRQRCSAQKTLNMSASVSTETAAATSHRSQGMNGAKRAGLVDDELEMLEVTDAGGEEASDIEHDIAIAEQENHNDLGPGGNEQGMGDSDDESVGGAHHPIQQAQAILLGGGHQ